MDADRLAEIKSWDVPITRELVAEVERLQAENATSMRLHATACERFVALASDVLRLAATNAWGSLVDLAADALNTVDAAEPGDQSVYARAKENARRADGR